MTDVLISNAEVVSRYGLEEGKTFEEQFSAACLESIIFDANAAGVHLSIQEYQQLKIDIEALLKQLKPNKPGWYANKAKLFQFGMELNGDTDSYDNSGLTSDQVEAMQVVKFADAYEPANKSVTFLKIATGSEGNRQPLPDYQYTAFVNYINRIAGAGIHIKVINEPADDIKLELDIYYDPLIMDNEGRLLNGDNDTPVPDAVDNYLDGIDFNGIYSDMRLIDALQAVDGVVIPQLKYVASRHGTYTEFSPINAFEVAYSGYYKILDDNLKLNYISYGSKIL